MITNYEGGADPTPPTARHTATKAVLSRWRPQWAVSRSALTPIGAIQVAFHLSSFLTGFAVALTGEAPVPTASALAGPVGH
jgi:hypothetical protein